MHLFFFFVALSADLFPKYLFIVLYRSSLIKIISKETRKTVLRTALVTIWAFMDKSKSVSLGVLCPSVEALTYHLNDATQTLCNK